MSTTYLASTETRFLPSDGAYRPEPVKTHAVASKNGVLARNTVCGVRVPGTPYGVFEATFVGTRCDRCAKKLGLEHIWRALP